MLFVFLGPCHHTSFKQCSGGPYFPLRKACFFINLLKNEYFWSLCYYRKYKNSKFRFLLQNYKVPF